ncbi:hypothetical protein J4E81_001697 [Alternaria sp. BMP 2799]|nr:hypothetical protein J4E81_001697 [Alternaria sp. BMP 2799]
MCCYGATHELRFLTWNKAYTIFPYETFIKETCHFYESNDERLWDYVVDAQKVGCPEYYWRTDGALNVAKDGPSRITRRIGDSRTWILDLDTAGVSLPETPDTILESSTFELRKCSSPFIFTSKYGYESLGPKEYPRYDQLYENLSHAVLKHRYLIPPGTGHSVMNKKCDAILKKLDRLTRVEMDKIPEVDWPLAFYEFEREELRATYIRDALTLEGFTLPATWTFYDEEILADLNDAWGSRDEVWVEDEGQKTEECEHEAEGVVASD